MDGNESGQFGWAHFFVRFFCFPYSYRLKSTQNNSNKNLVYSENYNSLDEKY